MNNKEKKYKKIILLLSIAIPLTVAALFGIKINGVDLSFLPPIYATINGITAITLSIAIIAIKAKNRKVHERFIKISLVLSALFLISYVAYHITSATTLFGDINHDGLVSAKEKEDAGFLRYLYFALLVSHILLSIAVIPFVLYSYLRAITGNFIKHKKIARIAFPLWLYVAVSGVLVYLFIAPYY